VIDVLATVGGDYFGLPQSERAAEMHRWARRLMGVEGLTYDDLVVAAHEVYPGGLWVTCDELIAECIRQRDRRRAAVLDALKAEIQLLVEQGKIGRSPTNEQRVDWAFTNAKIENDDVTREMAERAVAHQMPNSMVSFRNLPERGSKDNDSSKGGSMKESISKDGNPKPELRGDYDE
jgi:hypothetical protein